MSTLEYQRPPIRVALIGLGRSMFKEHLSVFKAHPSLFKVVAACDILRERRDIVAVDYPNCRMFRQIPDLLDEREIDLVDIATPSVDHVAHALKSLKKGFWTLLESPLALTADDAQVLRGQAAKSKNRLLMLQRGLFAPDFLLAQQEMKDSRLGMIYEIDIHREDFVRRDDWQVVKRLGGGAAYYAMPDLMIQALRLLGLPPIQMWSDLKRVASLGDAEDYVRVNLKTRTMLSCSIEYNGGVLEGSRAPSFVIKGERGTFSVQPGASEGLLRIIDPEFEFPRRRSSVRTPGLVDLHEHVPVVEIPVTLPKGTPSGPSAFWKHVYDTVRTAAPFPLSLDEALTAVKFSYLMKKTSHFAK